MIDCLHYSTRECNVTPCNPHLKKSKDMNYDFLDSTIPPPALQHIAEVGSWQLLYFGLGVEEERQ